ncbi:MAG: FliG C-terminal domain-containing protein [Planctomycetota bacterium]
MELSPTRKAALLLSNLDADTAAELLRAADPQRVTEIAAELAYVKAAGWAPRGPEDPVREFFGLLEQSDAASTSPTAFVEQVLQRTLGADQSRDAMRRVHELVEAKDPFLTIRSAEVEDLAEALSGETPQAVAVVLAELPQKTSGKLLGLLDEEVRGAAIRSMAGGADVAAETKARVAGVVRRRLEARRADGARRGDAKLRQVAVLLRGLGDELRKSMLDSIREQDEEAASGVERMMVLWEDVSTVSDRSMQEAVREVDARQLAMALVGADEATVAKIRGNLSERAAAMLDEETSLLSTPSDDDVESARQTVLGVLRELAGNGFLTFEEGD